MISSVKQRLTKWFFFDNAIANNKQFIEHINKINIIRITILVHSIMVVNILQLIMDYINWEITNWINYEEFQNIFVFHLFCLLGAMVVLVSILYSNRFEGSLKHKINIINTIVFVCFILIWGALTPSIGYLFYNDISIFIISVFGLSIGVYLSNKVILSAYFVSFSLLFFRLYYYSLGFFKIDFNQLLNAGLALIIGWGLSRINYRYKINEYTLNLQLKEEIEQRKLTELELQKLNNELESKILYRTTELELTNDKLVTEVKNKMDLLKELEKERHFLENIIEHNPYSIVISTSEGRAFKVNTAFKKLFKSVPPPDYSIFEDPYFINEGYGPYFEKIREGETVELPILYFNPHYFNPIYPSVDVWSKSKMFSVKNELGEIEHYVTMHEDVSEQIISERKIKDKEKQMTDFAEILPETVFEADLSGNLLFVNKKGLEKFGFSNEDLQNGLTYFNLIHPEDRQRQMINLQKIIKGERISGNEYKVIKKDGTIFHCLIYNTPIYKEGTLFSLMGVLVDITEHKKNEDKLKAIEANRKTIIDNTVQAFFLVDTNLKILEYNKAGGKLINYIWGKDVELGDNYLNYFPNNYNELFLNLFEKAKGGEFIEFESSFIFPTKPNPFWFNIIHAPIKNENGEIKEILLSLINITERKETEEKIIISENNYRKLVEYQIDLICRWKPDTTLTFVNTAYSNFYKRNKEDLVGKKWIDFISEETQENIMSFYDTAFKEKKVYYYEHESVNSKGELKWHLWCDIPILNNEGEIVELQSVGRDITIKKLAEQNLKNSLEEKEILLKEIHHRVKNNLQVISALFSLQLHYISEPKAKLLMLESQSRVKSMSLVHELLYKSESLSKINYKEYLNNLIINLIYTYNIDNSLIKVTIDADDVFFNPDIAINCGLIITELVSNSFKYAFKPKEKGMVFIKLKNEENSIVITVKDNGKGLPQNININNSMSLGLRLVKSITEQMSGILDLKNDNGASFSIKLKKLENNIL
ncbi:MAG: hypothetical protein A2X12_05105 [Bacteroidetes bacterium GWE2_29_8]|nr:MAG: hypothetical protein A2X12_05105 [Bacteroidetes bacterium GWE2_29_8]